MSLNALCACVDSRRTWEGGFQRFHLKPFVLTLYPHSLGLVIMIPRLCEVPILLMALTGNERFEGRVGVKSCGLLKKINSFIIASNVHMGSLFIFLL